MAKDKIIIGVMVALILGALAYLIYDLVTVKHTNQQHFANIPVPSNEGFEVPVAGESVESTETPKPVQQVPAPNMDNMGVTLPSECYPKEVLTSSDLLPADANSLWAQVTPSGQGSLGDQNFLTAGFHIGINTVGQSLRNANRQLRSEPPNPQMKVSPWLNTTIEPDLMRQPLEIGCGSP